MKILNINKFHYIKGGADRHYLDLNRLLAEHNHKVVNFAMQSRENFASPWDQYFVSNVDLSQVKLSWQTLKTVARIFYSWEARKKIKKLIQKEKPDIAHIHNIYHQISPSILGVLKKHKIPIVMTVHDYKLICPNYRLFNRGRICEKCKKHKYYQAVLNKCVKDSYFASLINCLEMYFHKTFRFYEKYVDRFICPSQFIKEKLKAWGLPQEKLTVLPYFINPEEFAPAQAQDYVFFFGRLSGEKGLKLLLQASQDLPQIKFKIAGRGPQKPELLNLVRKNKLTNVEFLGFKNKKELKKLILKSRFVVVPSIWQEVLGLTILESFNLAKTVIAAQRGGIPELIQEGKTGLLFSRSRELKEKIQYLYHNPQKAQEMGRRAKGQIKKYDPEAYYQKLEKIYQDLVS